MHDSNAQTGVSGVRVRVQRPERFQVRWREQRATGSSEQARCSTTDPHARRAHDTDAMFAFRQRMATDEAKTILRQRPSIAECRNRGLHQFRVRGLSKVRTVALWHAITFNFMRMLPQGALWGTKHRNDNPHEATQPAPSTKPTRPPGPPNQNTNHSTNPFAKKHPAKLELNQLGKNSQPLRARV